MIPQHQTHPLSIVAKNRNWWPGKKKRSKKWLLASDFWRNISQNRRTSLFNAVLISWVLCLVRCVKDGTEEKMIWDFQNKKFLLCSFLYYHRLWSLLLQSFPFYLFFFFFFYFCLLFRVLIYSTGNENSFTDSIPVSYICFIYLYV